VLGLAFLAVLAYLTARRRRAPALFATALGLFALLLVQGVVGETQYRTELPWWLVLVHVGLAAAVWAWCVALAALCFRPPLPIARTSATGVSAPAPTPSTGREVGTVS
jgi:heme A synthase